MISLTLPWPDPGLSPNARIHWRARAVLKRKARADSRLHTLAALGRHRPDLGDGPIRLSVSFHPKDRRRRDLDNALASLKHHFDGIADALGVDDSRFTLAAEMGAPNGVGDVFVQIYAEPGEGAE